MNLKLYEAKFEGMWPVGSGLIILAENEARAMEIAEETVLHAPIEDIKELEIKEGVVFYMSGEY